MTKKRIATLFGAALALGAFSAQAAPTLRYQADLHGSFVLTGNTLGQDCTNSSTTQIMPGSTVGACGSNTSDASPDVFWRSESPGAGQAEANTGITSSGSRSTAVLTLPAQAVVAYARLYWAALSPNNLADTAAILERPGVFTSAPLTADVSHTVLHNAAVLYESSADVTSIVTNLGAGAFRVSDVNSANLTNLSDPQVFAGWSLVVLYETPDPVLPGVWADPLRQVSVFDGLDVVTTGSPLTVNISGFLVPNSGIDASLGIVAYGGTNTGGSILSFNGTDLSDGQAGSSFFNASRTLNGAPVSNAGDLPRFTGNAGSLSAIDMDVMNVTPYVPAASTTASIALKPGSVDVTFGMAVTAITTYKPNFDGSVKAAVDVNGGSVLSGDIIRYTVDVTNTGNDPGVGVVFTDVIPTGVSFVPGSIQVVSGANAGLKTDAADADQGEYSALTNTVTIRLGTGANGSVGGTIPIGETSTVQFDVMVGSLAVGTIANQAVITAAGLNGAPVSPYTSTNGNGGPTTDVVVSQCEDSGDCPLSAPHCLLSGSPTLPNLCVPCLTNAHCSGQMPVCSSSHVCVPCSSDADCTNPTAPACQPVGSPLAGACGECSQNNSSLCGGSSPQCLTAIGQCGCSDTDGDSECGGPTSGIICNGPAGICVLGCVVGVAGRNDCPSTQFCSVTDGTVGTCSSQPCNGDPDCSAPTPYCRPSPPNPRGCVQCLNDGHCGAGLICDLSNNTCVQCTQTNTSNCSAGGSGAACLSNGTCGCLADTDCGGVTSGRVCDTASSVCIVGCRGTGGNGCPGSLVCTSTTNAIGSCVACTSNANCNVPTPYCNSSNICVGCLTSANCPATAPVCSGGTCTACTSNTDCAAFPAQPACNTAVGPLQGTCTECTATTMTLCDPVNTPLCLPAGVCGCSDTDGDAECGIATSGRVCSGPAGACIDGCSVAPSRNDCPATGYCNDRTGAVGACLAQCATNSDCTVAPQLVCNTAASPNVCVECVANTDCPVNEVCDTSSNTCVGCVTSADCPTATPVCNTATQLCVECLINANCPTGEVCDTSNFTCVGCLTNADCPSPLVCNPATQTCVGCLTTTDCTGAAVCTPTNTCVGCLTNADCTAPDVCDTTTNTCVRCLGNADCSAPTPVCDTSVPTCVGCLANTDCSGSTPVCDTIAKVCVGCTTNADCSGTTPICNPNTDTCVGCVTTADCTGNMVCNPTTNTCVGCTQTADCTGGLVCNPTTTTCVQCLVDTDCPTGNVCDTTTNTCVECTQDSHCASNPNGNTCLPNNTCGCTANTQCGSGTVCNVSTQACVDDVNRNVLEGGGCKCTLSTREETKPFPIASVLALAGLMGLRRRGRNTKRAAF